MLLCKIIKEAFTPSMITRQSSLRSLILVSCSSCNDLNYNSFIKKTLNCNRCTSYFRVQDPVIEQINQSVQKLTHSTNFLQFLGHHALIVPGDLQSSSDLVDDRSYHFLSLLLNLVNTFLYMVNTYIIVPTADDYSVSLGAAATVCGVIIGSMAVAQIFSSVYFSAWSNRSYFRPLVFSSIMLFFGNLLYALAYDMNSLTVLIVGRLLCGYSYYPLLLFCLFLCSPSFIYL